MNIAGVIGIDFGSNTSVIALASKGGVEILMDEGSHRETQNVVGFGENERFIGEHAYVQLKSNFKNTIIYPNRFLGYNVNHPNLNIESKFLYNKVVPNKDNKACFEVIYRNERNVFLPEQIVAMLLQKFKLIANKKGIKHNDIVISVPGYYTDVERKALLDAAKIAEINILKLMNEPTAIALVYGIFRKIELNDEPRNVVFVDFGHSHLSVFTASFMKKKLSIINQIHDRNLGARDLDWLLLEFYSKTFQEQCGLNPMKNDKARLRLLDAIEKQRKVLSANSDTTINIEFLMEDCDLNYTLTREKFESLIAPVAIRIRETLAKIIDPKITLHSVEIVGGATRIPLIQKIITEVFNIENCSKTLNASESIARGCAIQAAMLSPLFKVAEYGIEETNYFPIRCSWEFIETGPKEGKMEVENAKNNPQKQTSLIFDRGCNLPIVKSVAFRRDESVVFKVFYDESLDGFDSLIGHYFIHNIQAKEPEHTLKLKVHLNKNGIVELESAELVEEYYEDIHIPIEIKPDIQQPNFSTGASACATTNSDQYSNMEENQPEKEQKIKKKKKTRTTNLKIDIAQISGCNPEAIANFLKLEYQMAHQDKIIIETYEKKNELESYIYEMRNKLKEQYAEYTSAEIKSKFLLLLQAIEIWLYQDGLKASKNEYIEKTDELKKLGEPITKRFNEYQNIPKSISNFETTLAGYEKILNSNDPNLAHISLEEKQAILDSIKYSREFLQNIFNLLNSTRKDQNPPISTEEINSKHEEFINLAKPVINKPKPRSPKEEPKKPDSPGQQPNKQFPNAASFRMQNPQHKDDDSMNLEE